MKSTLTIIFFLIICFMFVKRVLLVEENNIEENLKNYNNKNND